MTKTKSKILMAMVGEVTLKFGVPSTKDVTDKILNQF